MAWDGLYQGYWQMNWQGALLSPTPAVTPIVVSIGAIMGPEKHRKYARQDEDRARRFMESRNKPVLQTVSEMRGSITPIAIPPQKQIRKPLVKPVGKAGPARPSGPIAQPETLAFTYEYEPLEQIAPTFPAYAAWTAKDELLRNAPTLYQSVTPKVRKLSPMDAAAMYASAYIYNKKDSANA